MGHELRKGRIVPGRHALLGPALAPPQCHKHLGHKMAVEPGEIPRPDHDATVGMPTRMDLEQMLGGTPDRGRHERRLTTEPDERFGRRGKGAVLAPRQDLVADEVAGMTEVGVGGIVAPRLVERLQKSSHRLAP